MTEQGRVDRPTFITAEELARPDEDTQEILASRRRWDGGRVSERFDFEATARK